MRKIRRLGRCYDESKRFLDSMVAQLTKLAELANSANKDFAVSFSHAS